MASIPQLGQDLTPREAQVFNLLCEGAGTAKEIARSLGISHRTVECFVANAIVKLGARNLLHAALLWDRRAHSRNGSPASTDDCQVNKEAPGTLLSRQGCELATDATKQIREEPQDEHSGILALMGQCKCARCKPVHLAAPQNDQDFRRRPASSEAAPSAEGSE